MKSASGAIADLLRSSMRSNGGVLRLLPAFVARDFLPPGRRLGLPAAQYSLGDRGGICERWLASTTQADNRVKVEHEGLSSVEVDASDPVTLKAAVEAIPSELLGATYATTHPRGLDRLAKIFDYQYRIPYHLHQMKRHAALVGRNPKEEAYYFPEGVPMGLEPETYLGVHPSVVDDGRQEELLPHLVEWKDDHILKHSKAYKLLPGDGWHIPAGILHAPGSALTIELQEDSDVFAMLQAQTGAGLISKELLFKDVRPEDRKARGERAILDMVDWPANGDPFFYEHHHTPPVERTASKQSGGTEHWIFYNTTKFSGTRIVVGPGRLFTSKDAGVFSLFVWRGTGRFGECAIESGVAGRDELLVPHRIAVEPVPITNTGREDLEIFKFFGPDVNTDVPMIKRRR